MVVQHNLTAMNSQRMLNITTGAQAKSTEKLSSGYKINRAADDAAGLAISEKMRRQIRGLTQASANASDGISCVQTAEGALTEVHDMLQRMNELAVKGENGTLATADRNYIAMEVQQLMSEIDRVKSTTTFNEKSLLDGKFTNIGLQVGAETGQYIKITIDSMSCSSLSTSYYSSISTFYTQASITASTTVFTTSKFSSLNNYVKQALETVSTQRSELGAIQNRLEHTIRNLDNVVENTTAAESQIRDTDMAAEMVRFSNNNILAQAGQSMLAQANQSNQGVLALLG
ncbi:MAG: flagellin [Lachnospiraceae bacterium]|nr:flagellin [Lachnospiraceae bacterium]